MPDKLIVVHSDGTTEPFKPRFISQTIMKETNIDKELAEKIQRRISNKFYKLQKDGMKEISTAAIRAEVSSQLLQEREFNAEEQSRKLGMSVAEFEDLLNNGCKDNANIFFSPEQVAKYAFDSIAKEHALLTMPKQCSEAHRNGYIHIHDLEYFSTRSNCANWSIPFVARNGLKVDGKGEYGSVAGPAKSLEVLLNQMLEFFMCGSLVLSGGQSWSSFNVYLAPFARNRTYKDIKQAIQNFIFNCNCALIAKGQTVFSSINIEFEVPDFLKNEPAVGPLGVDVGVYGDYEEEAKLIFKAIIDVTKEKDYIGRFHTFPNQIYMIRENTLDSYNDEVRIVHELLSENPTIYFSNVAKENAVTMGALTSDTPVMTDKGFKYPQSLLIGDNVMTYNNNGEKEWNEIYNIIPKVAPKKVFKITMDNNYQFKVTDNHKLPTNDGIIKSEDLKIGMELYNYIDEVFIPTDNYEAEFLGVFLADGYIRDKNRIKGRSSYIIEFHIKQDWKKNKIIELCKKNYYDYELIKRDDNTYTINVKEKDLRNKYNKCYDNNGVKHFPSWIWNDKNIIANVIKGLMFDGRKSSKSAWTWSSSDLPLVIDVLYALSYIGRKSTIYVDNRDGDTGNWRINYRITFGLNYNPKNNTKIKSIELVNNDEMVYDLSIKNNPNYVCGLGGVHSENCRTRMSQTFTGDYEKDCMNVGNFHYTTINLPLIAHESKNLHEFFETLRYYMDVSKDVLLDRKKRVEDVWYNKHMSDFLLQKDIKTGKQLFEIERCSFSIGICGLNECCLELTGHEVQDEYELSEKICNFMNDVLQHYKDQDGLRWTLFFSPSESTAHRFALINKDKHPNAYVQGTPGNYYLTNSNHIDVKSDINLVSHIQNADLLHPYAVAGAICHIWCRDTHPDPEALYSLNKKIAKTNVKFWAFTNDYTYCLDCGFTIQKAEDKCLECESDNIVTMSRITGYYQPVSGFNKGKQQEFKDRYRHEVH